MDTDERRRFAQTSHEYLIEQVQMKNCRFEHGKPIDLNLNFNHPVKELIISGKYNGKTRFNIGPSTPVSLVNRSQISDLDDVKLTLELNGHERFSEKSLSYFTNKQVLDYVIQEMVELLLMGGWKNMIVLVLPRRVCLHLIM